VRLVLVTGRRHPSARRVAEDLGGEVPLVLHNGALVVEAGRVRRCRPLPLAAALRAISAGRAAGAEPVLHSGQGGEGWLLVDAAARPRGLVGYYLERSRAEVRSPDLVAAVTAEQPIQIMFGESGREMDALLALLGAELGNDARIERTVYPSTGVVLLDVLHPAVGKAEALCFLQEHWGIAPSETLAIGDNWNDREMVERSGLGFVMGNADPDLLALGLPVLPTNDEDGVAHAIEEHVLGAGRAHPGAGNGPRKRNEGAMRQPPRQLPRRKKVGGETSLDPPNFPGALTSSSWRPSSWQPSSSPALR
jgi:hydroxymethylpyrimidine pyrophosphatase-like HAD family hydrolase